MRLSYKTWSFFIAISFLCALLWFKFGYPLFTHIDLSTDRDEALLLAKEYLTKNRSVDITRYHTAVVFVIDQNSDGYLQRTLGFEGELQFLKEHNFELFFWMVRFFREKEREEYLLTISCKTGEVTSFRHTIEDSTQKPKTSREEAKEKAEQFLIKNFSFSPDEYFLTTEFSRELDHRIDHTFAWEKKSASIPWKKHRLSGNARLLMGATVSGEELLTFSKFSLELPETYYRDLATKQTISLNLLTITRILNIALFVAAIFYLILRRNHLAMSTTRKFYYTITASIFLFTLLAELNELQNVILKYDTTQPIASFYGRHAVETILSIFFATIGVLMPSLSGEALHAEIFPQKKEGSFLHYVRTSFLTKEVFASICLGYLCFVIMVGLQTLAFKLGQEYFGIWFEQTWVTQLSAAYFPFLAAFYLGLRASFLEEIMFRLFTISWLTKVLKRTFLAVILSSLIWGLGHSGYLIFPMWFRALEVTALGFFLSIIYIKFGIITVLVAHYLFDVFWYSTGYLLGKTQPFHLYSMLFVILLPFVWGLVAYMLNRQLEEKRLQWKLNKHQEYNLKIIKYYLSDPRNIENKSANELKKEIVRHGWDIAVVDMAIEELKTKGKLPS